MPTTKQNRTHKGKPRKRATITAPPSRAQLVRALRGKFAFVPGSSDDFAKEKAREIEREG
jgi:hypothetical protein